jgi:nitrate reductase alpha subunit
MIDCNVRSEKMGWLPSAPQFEENPLEITKKAAVAKMEVKDYIVQQLKSKDLKFSCEDPDNPKNFPRNMLPSRHLTSDGFLSVSLPNTAFCVPSKCLSIYS